MYHAIDKLTQRDFAGNMKVTLNRKKTNKKIESGILNVDQLIQRLDTLALQGALH